jgi:transposase
MKASAIPSRYRLRVKQRLAIVEYAVKHGIKPASRRFGLERKTIRRWRDAWRTGGIWGWVPRYPKERATRLAEDLVQLISHARKDLQSGAPGRGAGCGVHKRQVPLATIQRTFKRLGMPRLPQAGASGGGEVPGPVRSEIEQSS